MLDFGAFMDAGSQVASLGGVESVRQGGTIVDARALRSRPRQRVQAPQMIVYTLTVCEAGSARNLETVSFDSGSATMEAIPDLLAKHSGCQRIRVHAGDTYLFSVDCDGSTLPD